MIKVPMDSARTNVIITAIMIMIVRYTSWSNRLIWDGAALEFLWQYTYLCIPPDFYRAHQHKQARQHVLFYFVERRRGTSSAPVLVRPACYLAWIIPWICSRSHYCNCMIICSAPLCAPCIDRHWGPFWFTYIWLWATATISQSTFSVNLSKNQF